MKQFWKKNFILRSYKTKEPRIEVVGETLQYALIEEKKKKISASRWDRDILGSTLP